jgi:dCMP deaminase
MAERKAGKKPAPAGGLPEIAHPHGFLDRVGQVEWDHYYMNVALAVRERANCLGSHVGAVLVFQNRIVSSGFNGTPAGFPNCEDGGCVRCHARQAAELGKPEEALVPELTTGAKQLDLCVCVHAEANALLSGARFGNRTEGATLYTTHKPCFACLKEAIQAGVGRLVYLYEWEASPEEALRIQYEQLAEHLRKNDARNFEQLEPQRDLVGGTNGELREPILDDIIEKAKEEWEEKQREREEAKAETDEADKPPSEGAAKPDKAEEAERGSAR